MDNGGHGQFGYKVAKGTTTVTIPSVPGHSFELPNDFFLIKEQQAPRWDTAGAYMPPCSGGRGNDYYVTIKALVLDSNKLGNSVQLGEAKLEMGLY